MTTATVASDQRREDEEVPGRKPASPSARGRCLARSAFSRTLRRRQSRSRSSSSSLARERGVVRRPAPCAARAASSRRDQRTATNADHAGAADAPTRYGNSHASRLKPLSIGDASDVLAAVLRDEGGDDLRRGSCPCATSSATSRASARVPCRTCASRSALSGRTAAAHADDLPFAAAARAALRGRPAPRRLSTCCARAGSRQQQQQQQQRRRGGRAAGHASPPRTRTRSRAAARCRAERQHAEAEPDPVHERIDRDRVGRRLRRDVVAGQHDVEVLATRAADRHLGRRLVLVLVEEPLRRRHRADRLAVLEHASRAP